jgi:hypothetical protein
MLKFDASIFRGELPVGTGVVGIAVVLPGGDFVDEDLFVGNAAIEAAMARSISDRAISGFVRAVRYSIGTPARSNRARLLVQLSGSDSSPLGCEGTEPTDPEE